MLHPILGFIAVWPAIHNAARDEAFGLLSGAID